MSYMTIPNHDAMLLRGSGADYDGPENDDPEVIAEMDAMCRDMKQVCAWADASGIEIPVSFINGWLIATTDDDRTIAFDAILSAIVEMFREDDDNWNLACDRVVQRYKDDADDHAAMSAEYD